ncbi:helix-turn-helix domain-containing protein [Mycobacterium sherrisii]|uniref:helix-turn-helix domain-containing protein n=1 Tax=Mycobacterium sherrisii TaxID=243061 RepID=UPI003976DE3C
MSAAVVAGGQDRQIAIAAAVQRVDAVQISPDVARAIHFWLGQYIKLTSARYGCPPDGVAEVQYALAETLAADSRQREQITADCAELLALDHEAVETVKSAARRLGREECTVRWMCRNGSLAAVKRGQQWFPKTAAVDEIVAQRKDLGHV